MGEKYRKEEGKGRKGMGEKYLKKKTYGFKEVFY